MKKAIALLLALVTLLSLTACAGKEDAASSALDQIKQKGELVVGTSADYPPYEFHTEVDGKDTIVGFDMEIAQAIADKLGVPLKIVDMSFDNLLMSLANDEFDLVIAGLTADEERRKTTDFSDPYLESKNLILVRAEDADKYASLDDLKGVKGGAQTGSKPYNNCITYCGEETTVGLAKVQDLVMELVGRLPVVTTLGSLKKEELVRILTEPKNALCRQYRKLLELDNVTLEFENAALDAIAQKAIDRKIGARGLRAVLESVMTKVMYDIPSDPTISEVLITRACVEDGSEPEIRHKAGAARRKRPSAG